MARDAIVFIEALKLDRVDVLGFSLGGFVAQEVALLRPYLVRKLILAGTGPQGGPQMHGWRQDIADAARKPAPGAEEMLYIFFKHTETSRAKGGEFLGGSCSGRRIGMRRVRWLPSTRITMLSSNGAYRIITSCRGWPRSNSRRSWPMATTI